MTTTAEKRPADASKVGIRCPHGCGFVAVLPLVNPRKVSRYGWCPKCKRTIRLM